MQLPYRMRDERQGLRCLSYLCQPSPDWNTAA